MKLSGVQDRCLEKFPIVRLASRFVTFAGANMSTPSDKPFAVVTGASSGIGYELAKEFARHGFDLLIAADSDRVHQWWGS